MTNTALPERETLVIIVGAGASLKAGLPSTDDLKAVTIGALPQLIEPGLAFEFGGFVQPPFPRKTALGDVLHAALLSTFASYDFDVLLNALEELEILAYARELPLMVPEFRPVTSAFVDFSSRFARIADSALLRSARLSVIKALHSHVGDRSKNPIIPNRDGSDPRVARAQLQRILQTLAHSYRLVVIDLCYDDIIDSVDVLFEDGFSKDIEWSDDPNFSWARVEGARAFSPEAWDRVQHGTEHLLIHLHGSVLYGRAPVTAMKGPHRFSEPIKYATTTEALQSLDSISTGSSIVAGQNVAAEPIISGRQKGGKLIFNTRPYGYYYRSLMDLVPRSRRLLVMGYSWRDPHLNSWIEEMIDRQPERRVAVVTYLPGTEVFANTSQQRFLTLLGEHSWRHLESQAYAPNAYSPDTPGFYWHGNFAIAPSGFVLGDDDERRLLEFVTT